MNGRWIVCNVFMYSPSTYMGKVWFVFVHYAIDVVGRKGWAVTRCFIWLSDSTTRNCLLTYCDIRQLTSTGRHTDDSRPSTSPLASPQVGRQWFSGCEMWRPSTHLTSLTSSRIRHLALMTVICKKSSVVVIRILFTKCF